MAVRTLKFCDRHPDEFFFEDSQVETIVFGLEGRLYEMEMCTQCQEEFHGDMNKWVDGARAVKGRGKAPKSDEELSTTAKIRIWAEENGLDVKPVGVIPNDVMDAYFAALSDNPQVVESEQVPEEETAEEEEEPPPAKAVVGNCKWCGRGFGKYALVPHQVRCPKNPDRLPTQTSQLRNPNTPEKKKAALELVERIGRADAARELGIHVTTLNRWRHELSNPVTPVPVVPKNTNGTRIYTPEEKRAAVDLANEVGLTEAARQLGFNSHSMIARWRDALAPTAPH